MIGPELSLIIPMQIGLIIANFMVLVCFILAFYIIAINPKNTPNYYVAAFIFTLAMTNLGVVLAIRAESFEQAEKALLLASIFGLASGATIMLAILMLLKPEVLEGKYLPLRIALVLLAVIPGLILLSDYFFHTRLIYAGYDAAEYPGGFMEMTDFLTGILARPVVVINVILFNTLVLLPLFYLGFIDKRIGANTRRLGRYLFTIQLVTITLSFGLRSVFIPGASILITSLIYTVGYAVIAFRGVTQGGFVQAGRLGYRLTALTLVIAVPSFIYIAISVIDLSSQVIRNKSVARLEEARDTLIASLGQRIETDEQELESLTDLPFKVGETGLAYLVDDLDTLRRTSRNGANEESLRDYSGYPAVVAMRNGQSQPVTFNDQEGNQWFSYYAAFENGWGLIVQQQVAEIDRDIDLIAGIAWVVVPVGAVILMILIWLAIRQTVKPINALTETVTALARGDLNRTAPVTSEDEIGTLAKAFNTMTLQLRDLVGSLELRVAERTLDLEHRSAQLQAAADVGRATATIRDMEALLTQVTRLISASFGFYHVGIFLLDENKHYAMLRAANSPGGQKMLEHGHKLKVGQQGIVGYVTGEGKPRVALNVGQDATFFNNPDLPETQSEMALPLMVGDELLGALDVQSRQEAAFSEQDMTTLQVLADQVAIAISHARLYEQTQQLLESERKAYGEISRQTWSETLKNLGNLGYRRGHFGLQSVAELPQGGNNGGNDSNTLALPVRIRNQQLAILSARKSPDKGGWTSEERQMLESLVEQLGVALESARAYQETQLRAEYERISAQVISRLRETMDTQSILKTAALELRRALDLPEVYIHLESPLETSRCGAPISPAVSQNLNETGDK